MKTIKAITFFDLDGTLLDQHSKITPEIRLAIESLKRNNILPVIATGRTLVEINSIMQESGITSAIVMNGQFIQVDGKKIYSNEFSYKESMEIYHFAQELNHEVAFYNEKKIWCSNLNQTGIACYDYVHTDPPIADITLTAKEPVNMLLILSENGDQKYLDRFPELTFYRNGPYSMDVVRKNVSKGFGVMKLFETLEIKDIPTYAFGDGINDLALFEACDHKIAMGNARDELKAIATFITKENTDQGIVHALRHYHLI